MVLRFILCVVSCCSPYGQLSDAVMVNVQHLQSAALTQPVWDTSQLVPLREKKPSQLLLTVSENARCRHFSYLQRSRTVRFSGTGSTFSCINSANTSTAACVCEGDASGLVCFESRRDLSVSTVMTGMQALEGVAADSEEGEGVSVAAEQLQLPQRADVQLLKAGIPHVQLDDVEQLL